MNHRLLETRNGGSGSHNLRIRSPNFTEPEVELLKNLLQFHRQTLSNKNSNNKIIREKNAAWMQIKRVYNRLTPGPKRTRDCLQKKLANMRKEARSHGINIWDSKEIKLDPDFMYNVQCILNEGYETFDNDDDDHTKSPLMKFEIADVTSNAADIQEYGDGRIAHSAPNRSSSLDTEHKRSVVLESSSEDEEEYSFGSIKRKKLETNADTAAMPSVSQSLDREIKRHKLKLLQKQIRLANLEIQIAESKLRNSKVENS